MRNREVLVTHGSPAPKEAEEGVEVTPPSSPRHPSAGTTCVCFARGMIDLRPRDLHDEPSSKDEKEEAQKSGTKYFVCCPFTMMSFAYFVCLKINNPGLTLVSLSRHDPAKDHKVHESTDWFAVICPWRRGGEWMVHCSRSMD